MKRSELVALLRQVGARGPISGPEKAWVVPSASVDRLADSVGAPEQLQPCCKEVDVINVDTAVLHGVFTAAELKDVLARMKTLGKPDPSSASLATIRGGSVKTMRTSRQVS